MRVVVANSHRHLRLALGERVGGLLPGAEVLEAADAEGVRRHLAHGPVRLVLVHAHTPEGRGVAPLVDLRRRASGMRLMVVSDVLAAGRIRHLLTRGVDGCIRRSIPDRVMHHALDLVLAGETFVPPEILTTTEPAA